MLKLASLAVSRDYGTLKSEQAIIKSIGGVPTKNSGRSSMGGKGDGIWHQFCLDVKETAKSFTINKAVWGKACTDALTHRGKDPLLLVVIDGQTRLAVVELEILEQLLEEQ